MMPLATAMSKFSAAPLALAAMAAGLSAAPATARANDEPAAARSPDAQDVAMTPLTDLNLTRDEIPAILVAATSAPYASDGLTSCKAIEAAIADLDAALGPDMDVALHEGDRLSTGRMAKSVVASFIPFRGILREISGAADQERNMRAAIYAGAVRRGFLKGLGQQQGCPYPARPAFTRVQMTPPPPPASTSETKRVAVAVAPPAATFVSEPVVQPIPARRRR